MIIKNYYRMDKPSQLHLVLPKLNLFKLNNIVLEKK